MSDELTYIDNIVKKSLEGARVEQGVGWEVIDKKITESGIGTSGSSFFSFNTFKFNIYYAAAVVILSLLGISYLYFDQDTKDDLLRDDNIVIPVEADDITVDEGTVKSETDMEEPAVSTTDKGVTKEITPEESVTDIKETPIETGDDIQSDAEKVQNEETGREAEESEDVKTEEKETTPVNTNFNVYDTVNLGKKLLFQDTAKTIIFEER